MSLLRAPLAIGVATLLSIGAACGDGSHRPPGPEETALPAAAASPSASAGGTFPATADQTGWVFDQAIVHQVAFEVPAAQVAKLNPGSEERIAAKLTFDGTAMTNVGLRLKAGEGSRRPLGQKPGFSVDTDSFVKGLSLSGVTRFTLGNAANDPSFVVESLVYSVFRRAGIIAPRTALAAVQFNGEMIGLYVLREGYDKNFLRRNFVNAEGNLYEGAYGVDVTDVEHMDPKTNETGGRADLRALARVVAETPEDRFFAAIGQLVDLDRQLSYWAVESIVNHWDGYIQPNNYYVYDDPTSGKLVFFAHGADWSMVDPVYPIFQYPGASSRLGGRLWDNLQFHALLRARLGDAIERYWDAAALLAQADRLAALVRATGLTGTQETATMEGFERALAERKAFVSVRAANVRAQLAGTQRNGE